MTPAALLMSLFDADASDVLLSALEDEVGADVAKDMVTGSFFEAEAKVKDAPCLACDQAGHPVQVRWCDATATYRAWCPSAGSYTYPTPACETVRFSCASFARRIGEALNVQEWRERWIIKDILLHIGTAQLGARPWSLLLARRLSSADSFAQVLRRNLEGAAFEKGLIIGSFKPDLTAQLQRGLHHQFRTIDDVLDWESGALVERPSAVRHYLARSPATTFTEPTKQVVHRIFADHVATGQPLPKGKKLMALLRQKWPKDRKFIETSQMYKLRGSFLAKKE